MPSGLHINECQLPQDLGGEPLAACGPGGRERTVQHHGPFAVEAAHGVHQGGPQGRQHIREHQRIPGAPGFLGRAPQRLDAGVGRARVEGCFPGSQQRPGDHAGPQPHRRSRSGCQRRGSQSRGAGQALPGKKRLAPGQMHGGPGGMPGRDQRAQEQLLRALVERIQRYGAPGRFGGRLGVTRAQLAQRRPAKLLHRPGRASATGQHEPDVECRAVPRLHTLQQHPADLGGGQGTVPQCPDINPQGPVGQTDRIAPEQPRVLAATPQIGQRPPQRPQRVICLAEQLRRKLSPGQRPVG